MACMAQVVRYLAPHSCPYYTHTQDGEAGCVTQEESQFQEGCDHGFGVWRQGGTGGKVGYSEPCGAWITARK